MEDKELSTAKLYTKTLQQLKTLKKQLGVKNIKDVMHHLVEASKGNTVSTELLASRTSIRAKQDEIIAKCVEIRDLLNAPVVKLRGTDNDDENEPELV